MSHAPVYLDYHATTPVDPRVLEAMLPYFTETLRQPGVVVSHAWGWKAQEAVEAARREVATLIGATAREIVFTSGATESNNFAIHGVVAERAGRPAPHRRVGDRAQVVLEASKRLEPQRLARHDRCRSAATAASISTHSRRARDDATALVSVMAANNEIGVIQPLAEIGAIAHARGALLHVDAAQAAGKIPIDVKAMQHRSAVAHGPQDVRPEGLRRALHPQTHRARAAHRRRRTGARHAVRHAQRAGHRRARAGVRDLPGGDGGGERAARRVCAIDCSPDCARARWRHRQRIARAPAAAQSARQLRRRRRRVAAASASATSRCRRDRRARSASADAVARAARAPRRRRVPPSATHPLRPRPLHDRGRHRLHDREVHDRRRAACAIPRQ